METTEIRKLFERKKGEQKRIQLQITKTKRSIISLKKELSIAEQAHLLIQTVAVQTQENLRYKLSELAELGLASIFDNPYKFQIDFETKRGRTEADFWFVRDGAKISAKSNAGFGAVDIAGISLRVSIWSLNKNRAVMILDEPFKHLKGSVANSRALQFLKEICTPQPEKNWEGMQIIMVADERTTRQELMEISDSIYEFKKVKNSTVATKIKTDSGGDHRNQD